MSAHLFKATLLLGCLLAAACRGGDGATGPLGNSGVRIVGGINLTDTITARPPQGLVVEVRDDNGVPLANTVVRFEAVRSTVPGRTFEPTILVAPQTSQLFNTFAAVPTNERGRAVVVLQFGTVAGPAKLVVTVPDLGTRDTVRYEVLAGNAARIAFTARDTVVRSGATYSLGASSADRFGNRRPNDNITFTAGPSVAAVDAAGVVTAGDVGLGFVVATTAMTKDTARLTVVPVGSLVVASARTGSPVVATMDLDGTNYQVIATVSGTEVYPKWNRQGTKILFQWGESGAAHLYVVSPGGAPQRLLDASAGIGSDAYGRFSADGNTVYFSGRAASAPGYALNLFRVRQGESSVEYLGPGTPGQDYGYSPDPSPDEARVVFSSGRTLELMDLASGQLTDYGTSGAMPHFSPDGRLIAYIAAEGPLMVMNPDGSGKRSVSAGHTYQGSAGFDWSPDGRWLIIRGNSGLELINVQSGQLLALPYSAALYQPAFHP